MDELPRELLQLILQKLKNSSSVRTISSLSSVSKDIRESVTDHIGENLFENLDIYMEQHIVQTYDKINTNINYNNEYLILFYNQNKIKIKSIINKKFENDSFSCLYGKYFVEIIPINCRIFDIEAGIDFRFSDILKDFVITDFIRIDSKTYSHFSLLISTNKSIFVDIIISQDTFNYQIANYFGKIKRSINIYLNNNFIYFINKKYEIYYCNYFKEIVSIVNKLNDGYVLSESDIKLLKEINVKDIKNIKNKNKVYFLFA